MRVYPLESDRVRLGVTEVGGQLDNVRFATPAGTCAPLHTAPWIDEPHGGDVPPMLQNLRGDFFCAPFGDNDVLPEETRGHGSTANAAWRVVEQSPGALLLELEPRVSGARVTKRVSLRPGQAAVYQEHVCEGGEGRLPLGHHAMLRAEEPLLLGFSRWVWGGTPPSVFEPDPQRGRSLLAYPQEFDRLERVRLADGTTADLTRYPVFDGHEDLLMLVADPSLEFAWSAATNAAAGWVWYALKSPAVLRNTILWMSNGGRYYPPFSRRHRHVIGIEETTSYFHLGHRASLDENELTRRGYPTTVTLRPNERLVVRYVFGLAAIPGGFGRVQAVRRAGAHEIELVDTEQHSIRAACEVDFVTQPG